MDEVNDLCPGREADDATAEVGPPLFRRCAAASLVPAALLPETPTATPSPTLFICKLVDNYSTVRFEISRRLVPTYRTVGSGSKSSIKLGALATLTTLRPKKATKFLFEKSEKITVESLQSWLHAIKIWPINDEYSRRCGGLKTLDSSLVAVSWLLALTLRH